MPSIQQQQQQDKLKQLGNDLVQKREFTEAAKFYERALELDSTSESSAAIFSNRSLCYLNIKRFKEALQDAEKAISLRPTWHRGYQRAAAACEKLEKCEEGLKHLEKCFELDVATRDDAALKKMEEDFEVNIIKQKAPSMTQDELKQVGNNYIKNQQYHRAITVYTLAIEKDAFCDAAVPILSNRSMAYFKLGKFKEAYEDGGFCCGIKPDWAKGFMRRGVAAEKLEEWQIALESYDEYLKLDPSDEAGVRSSRDAVMKVLARKKREAEQERLEREELKRELEGITDPDKQLSTCLVETCMACAAFDVENMKITMDHKYICKPRLDIRVSKKFFSSNGTVNVEQMLLPSNLNLAARAFAASPANSETVLFASYLMSYFTMKHFFGRVPISCQVQVLDFILDLSEEQDFIASPEMETGLHRICWYDPTSLEPKFASIRKDLVISVFNRIDTSRKFFLGKSFSNKDFATAMLSAMCADMEAKRLQMSMVGETKDICSQDLYECICTAIKHGADANSSVRFFSNNLTPLASAVANLRSLRVVELLLRCGAGVNVSISTDLVLADAQTGRTVAPTASCSTTETSTPLSLALRRRRPDLARALIAYGAKLPTERLPDKIWQCAIIREQPLVKQHYAKVLIRALTSLPRTTQFREEAHEYLQLLFETISNQGLSFLLPNADGTIETPLTFAHKCEMDLHIVETMIKLKPELLQLVIVAPGNHTLVTQGLTPLGILIYEAEYGEVSVPYLVSVANLFLDHGANFGQIVQYGLSTADMGKFSGSALIASLLKKVKSKGKSAAGLEALQSLMIRKKRQSG